MESIRKLPRKVRRSKIFALIFFSDDPQKKKRRKIKNKKEVGTIFFQIRKNVIYLYQS